jgi:hypothetical protein
VCALCGLGACGGRIEGEGESDLPDAGVSPFDAAGASDATTSGFDAGSASDATTTGYSPDVSPPAVMGGGGYDASARLDADADALPTVVCDAGQPDEVCVEYYALVSACFGRDALYLACQPALIPDGGDNQEIEQLCATNLQRLQPACQ